MSTYKAAAFAAALALWSIPGLALATPASVQLIIGGEAYDGPPKFEVSFDGKVLGEGAVGAAIDTAKTGRFADAADKSPYVQSFSFDIPETIFKPKGEVRVRLLNEAFGGEGSNHDRNLYLASVAVNGRAVTLSGLTTQTGVGVKPNEVLGEFLVLRDGNVSGVSQAPGDGWPAADAVVAGTIQPAAAVTEVAAKPAETAAPAAVAAPVAVKAPVRLAAIKVPEAPAGKSSAMEAPAAEAPTIEPIETASLDPDPEGGATSCTRDELYNVVGFNENSNDLTPRLSARLDQIIADIGKQKCTVLVTGFSSRQGNHATNALFAIERAQKVLAYLKDNGLNFKKVSATGGGATEQFGKDFSANRRVVITVLP